MRADARRSAAGPARGCSRWSRSAFFAVRSLTISTDLRSFMPPPQTPDQKLLMDQIGEGPGTRLLLLAIDGAPPEQLADAEPRPRRRAAQATRISSRSSTARSIRPRSIRNWLPYRYLLSPTLDHARARRRVSRRSAAAARRGSRLARGDAAEAAAAARSDAGNARARRALVAAEAAGDARRRLVLVRRRGVAARARRAARASIRPRKARRSMRCKRAFAALPDADARASRRSAGPAISAC